MASEEHDTKQGDYQTGDMISFQGETGIERREILRVTQGAGGLFYEVDPPDGFFCIVRPADVIEPA